MRRDLAVLGRSRERHLAEKVTLALVGLLFAPAIGMLLTLGGAHLPVIVPVWAALVCMVSGFFLPDLGIRVHLARSTDPDDDAPSAGEIPPHAIRGGRAQR